MVLIAVQRIMDSDTAGWRPAKAPSAKTNRTDARRGRALGVDPDG
jgi:hypothetical protein